MAPTDIDFSTDPFDDDKLREECGVFGVFADPNAASHTALGLHALQHRGQEAAGIVTFDGTQFHSVKGPGHVSENFKSETVISQLVGSSAIGHVRYSTTGGAVMRNIQPLFAEFAFGGLAIAHNGNLTNAMTLRERLVQRGCLFQSTSDTEVIVHLIAISICSSVEDRIIDALRQVQGAYSIVALTNNALIGVRDPMGIRPLVLGQLDGAYIFASETCALDIIGADYIRDVEPGELIIITGKEVRSLRPFPQTPSHFCVFEYIYFARPDSIVEERSVYEVRKAIGRELARESAVEADVVVPVPDSGVPSALGYAAEAGLPFEYGIIRNHYVGRTFIQPTDKTRNLGVKRKHNPNRSQLEGKRVILVDDSIVRGTTSTKIVEMVRQAGAREVHMRISSPPTAYPCFYGIDTPEREKLLAANYSVEDMAKLLGVDSLAFVSLDGLYRAAGVESRNAERPQFCDACFSGHYPVPNQDRAQKSHPLQLALLND
ncbi:amidophosphoribosyltransferase [Rhodospirillum rubrum]|uniref:Amidophosphoribosyltransferase n=1 Tax=Rhodospirillum rubrum (strain ATCC 11170 / ATH 1.1.1 / DSM 467 / LMG 4362 / NCIMB 8255 / S1) TaxID=269796 RepID=Q2RXD6_RHORT|nr:amidophosphoribosyltransferase [Rhodospirillum rubrum]ABC21209.1 amidophosphoribosyltransferase [Rhodospirillum rubrum ATCC 11170]AEO46884.1 amidophosphoribosyltransferase [Rhodospirillum rubrum F11]MBK5952761.1 amidophosphoribosyltransferase [Rhodospirillum rubrum]QXG80900.1 amidophosphoribosyltransferase [Rhodospirillum rubrum]HAQ00871.1 amidophosphoribosyltransferase [Rhodospirillum rubrum]